MVEQSQAPNRYETLVCGLSKDGHSFQEIAEIALLELAEVMQHLTNATSLTEKEVRVVYNLKGIGKSLKKISEYFLVDLEVLEKFMPSDDLEVKFSSEAVGPLKIDCPQFDVKRYEAAAEDKEADSSSDSGRRRMKFYKSKCSSSSSSSNLSDLRGYNPNGNFAHKVSHSISSSSDSDSLAVDADTEFIKFDAKPRKISTSSSGSLK